MDQLLSLAALIVCAVVLLSLYNRRFPGGPRAPRLSMEEARHALDGGAARPVVDVRTQEEFDGGHIPGARLLPVDTIASAAPEALPDLQAELWLYCQSGRRSAAAGRALLAMGYQQVRDLGGIGGWTGPLVRE